MNSQYQEFNKIGKNVFPSFSGKKIKISKILNKQIIIFKFKKLKSIFSSNDYFQVEFSFFENQEDLLVFETSSIVIKQTLEKYSSSLPFTTKIVKHKNFYIFN
jgi:hypothetical protein